MDEWIEKGASIFFLVHVLHIANDLADIYSFHLFIYQTHIYRMPLCPTHTVLRLVEKTDK